MGIPNWNWSLTTSSLPPSIPVVPDKMRVTLPYSEVISRTPGTFEDDYQFNLNSIFDPNRTGTGHQPLGHDQWNQFYNRYRVTSVDVEFKFLSQSADNLLVSLFASNGTASPTILTFAEQPFSKTGTIGSTSGGNAVMTLRASWDLSKITGLSRQQYLAGENYQAQFGSSPAELMILHSYVVNPLGTNATYTLFARIHYNVELFDRIQLTSS
jgi:hypothetical protein